MGVLLLLFVDGWQSQIYIFYDLNNPLCSNKNEALGPKVNIEESTDSDTSSASDKSNHADIKKSITLSKVPKSKDHTSAGPAENYSPKNTRTSSLEDFLPIPPKIPFSPISMLNKMFDEVLIFIKIFQQQNGIIQISNLFLKHALQFHNTL